MIYFFIDNEAFVLVFFIAFDVNKINFTIFVIYTFLLLQDIIYNSERKINEMYLSHLFIFIFYRYSLFK